MYCDFMDKGDFEMVRVLIEALNATNPGLNLGEETITGVESALRRMRGLLLCEQTCVACAGLRSVLTRCASSSRSETPSNRAVRAHAALRNPARPACPLLL